MSIFAALYRAEFRRPEEYRPVETGAALTRSQEEKRGVRIRPVRRGDNEMWGAMRRALWPLVTASELYLDIERWWWIGDPDSVCLVAEEGRRLVGFIEMSIRERAQGCRDNRVAYVEGWYVEPGARRRGIGRALLRAAESWGKGKNCRVLGSDTVMGDADGSNARLACGFAEVERLICYRKIIE